MKYLPPLLSLAAPGYGGNRASCLARGQIRWGRAVSRPVKDANPELIQEAA